MLKRRSHRFLIISREHKATSCHLFSSHPLTLSISRPPRLQLPASFFKFVLVSSEKKFCFLYTKTDSLTASYLDLIYDCLTQKSLDTPPKSTRRSKDQKPHGIPTEKDSIERVPSGRIQPHGTKPEPYRQTKLSLTTFSKQQKCHHQAPSPSCPSTTPPTPSHTYPSPSTPPSSDPGTTPRRTASQTQSTRTTPSNCSSPPSRPHTTGS